VAADRELGLLLAEEIRRHTSPLSEGASETEQRRAIHALKGSAGVAGERALFESLARIERRLVEGDHAALGDARLMLSRASEALLAGQTIPAPVWPEPPLDLRATPPPLTLRVRYAAEMSDRLARIDELLSGALPETSSIAALFREIHAMKAASLAASDEATAWFCHGLEERTRDADRAEESAKRAIAEVARWRGLLGEIIAAPDRALDVLRRLAARSPSSRPPPSLSAPESAESDAPAARVDGETLRVPASSLDRLLDRVRSLESAETSLATLGRELSSIATRARRLRSALSLAEGALDVPSRALASARIREASTSVASLSDALDREAATLLGVAERAREGAHAAHADIARMRTTTASSLFDRVVAFASVQALRASRDVDVTVRGGDTPVDRRIAEDLLDPLLQLAQNAIAHGIEPPFERVLRGKPSAGALSLSAELRGALLVLVVSDDGAGVDVEAVRVRARSRGTLSPARALSADQQALLGLLFVPGFSTRESADMLAGRGVGLGLVREAVRRQGGSVRIASRPGAGFSATIEVPIERGVVRVLAVRAGGATYVLPARLVRRVLCGPEVSAELALPLAACVRGLGAIVSGEALGPSDVVSYALELDPGRDDGASCFVSVDAVGDIDEATLHAPPPLIAQAGPYIGAVVSGDAVHLCLDVFALAELVHLVRGRR